MNEWITTLGSASSACLINILFWLAAFSIGSLFISTFKNWKSTSSYLLSLIIGSNLMALIFFLLAIFGVFKYFSPVFFMALLIIPLIMKIIDCLRQRKKIKLQAFPWATFMIIAFAAIFLSASLSLPIGWDEMVYHQSIIQRWIFDGFPNFYPDLPYSAFPASEAFIFWGLSAQGTVIGPRLFIWCCWVLSLLTIYRIIILNKLTSVKAVIIVLGLALSKTVLLVVSDAYVETLLLLNTAGIILVITEIQRQNSKRHSDFLTAAAFCGILAGSAGAIKLTGLVLFVIPAFWLLFFSNSNKKKSKEQIKQLGIFLVCGLLVSIPFYIRPYLTTGNPFYPYFCNLFTDSAAQISMSEFHHLIGSARFGNKSFLMFFSAPFALAFSTKTFDGSYGWQLLPIIILAVWGIIKGKNKNIRLLGASVLVLYVFWFFTAQQARFFLPGISILFICAGIYISDMKKNYQRTVISLILLLTLISIPWKDSGYYYFSWTQLLGKTKKIDYLHIGTGGNYLPAVDAIINLTPKDSKLMVMFEHRILYFPRETVIATPYFQEKYFTPTEEFTTGEKIEQELAKSKADFLLVAIKTEGPDEIPQYLKKQRNFVKVLSTLIPKGKLKEIWRSNNYSLFKINQ